MWLCLQTEIAAEFARLQETSPEFDWIRPRVRDRAYKAEYDRLRWTKKKQDNEYITLKRKRSREWYAKAAQDPAFLQRRRDQCKASYHRMKPSSIPVGPKQRLCFICDRETDGVTHVLCADCRAGKVPAIPPPESQHAWRDAGPRGLVRCQGLGKEDCRCAVLGRMIKVPNERRVIIIKCRCGSNATKQKGTVFTCNNC